MPKSIHEQFGDFTELFSADGYQFIELRTFMEGLESKPVSERSYHDTRMLNSFEDVSKLCRFFLDQNPLNQ